MPFACSGKHNAESVITAASLKFSIRTTVHYFSNCLKSLFHVAGSGERLSTQRRFWGGVPAHYKGNCRLEHMLHRQILYEAILKSVV